MWPYCKQVQLLLSVRKSFGKSVEIISDYYIMTITYKAPCLKNNYNGNKYISTTNGSLYLNVQEYYI
jgi:hypothetical protein